MNEANTNIPHDEQPGHPPRRRFRGRGLLFLGLVALAGGIVGAFAGKAFSHGPHMFGHFGHGPGFWRTAGGPFDPAKAAERAERMAKHLAVEIDATKEQQEKLAEIAKAFIREVGPQRDVMIEARKQAVDLLTKPDLDRGAIEKLRADQIANAELVSRQLTQALVKAAEVMTPEQRKKIAERIEEWREHRGWWRGGRDKG